MREIGTLIKVRLQEDYKKIAKLLGKFGWRRKESGRKFTGITWELLGDY